MKSTEEELAEGIELIESFFPARKIRQMLDQTDREAVVDYYVKSIPLYLKLYSGEGFMHYPLNGDYYAQAKKIAEYIRSLEKENINVLEFGAGNGVNSQWLAKQFPQVKFTATDLMNTGFKHNLPNFRQIVTPFNEMAGVPDGHYDLAFGIETFCYSKDKVADLSVIKQKLSFNGIVVIYDAYVDRAAMTTTAQEKAATYVARAWSLLAFEDITDMTAVIKGCRLELVEYREENEALRSKLAELSERSRRFLTKKDLRTILLKQFSPFAALKNIIPGILFKPLVDGRIYLYCLHVLRKVD